MPSELTSWALDAARRYVIILEARWRLASIEDPDLGDEIGIVSDLLDRDIPDGDLLGQYYAYYEMASILHGVRMPWAHYIRPWPTQN